MSSAMPDYAHDIFLSVKSDATFGEWVSTIFIPLFETYITQEIFAACKRKPDGIFYYKKSLKAGDPWPADLRQAITESRIAVALCSPEYFYSEWCLTEFHTFWERGKSKKARVLVPASIYDGEAFPSDVKGNLQFEDFSEFVIVGEGFKLTKKYSDFQDVLKQFAKRVAELVAKAPTFETWPVVEKAVLEEAPEVPQQTLST
jgi:hypothetical protein